ncbi:hypothetical protein B0H13DRAFT_1178394 [Mycena leptocephala]|nr:hypothetical protein B0H13DRAFT_1178394 [Mycena leptocephala]
MNLHTSPTPASVDLPVFHYLLDVMRPGLRYVNRTLARRRAHPDEVRARRAERGGNINEQLAQDIGRCLQGTTGEAGVRVGVQDVHQVSKYPPGLDDAAGLHARTDGRAGRPWTTLLHCMDGPTGGESGGRGRWVSASTTRSSLKTSTRAG